MRKLTCQHAFNLTNSLSLLPTIACVHTLTPLQCNKTIYSVRNTFSGLYFNFVSSLACFTCVFIFHKRNKQTIFIFVYNLKTGNGICLPLFFVFAFANEKRKDGMYIYLKYANDMQLNICLINPTSKQCGNRCG